MLRYFACALLLLTLLYGQQSQGGVMTGVRQQQDQDSRRVPSEPQIVRTVQMAQELATKYSFPTRIYSVFGEGVYNKDVRCPWNTSMGGFVLLAQNMLVHSPIGEIMLSWD